MFRRPIQVKLYWYGLDAHSRAKKYWIGGLSILKKAVCPYTYTVTPKFHWGSLDGLYELKSICHGDQVWFYHV
jgi:hypothetical protein